MGDSPGLDRPPKRVRYAKEDEFPAATLQVDLGPTAAIAPHGLSSSISPSELDPMWRPAPTALGFHSPSQLGFTLAPNDPTSWIPHDSEPEQPKLELDMTPPMATQLPFLSDRSTTITQAQQSQMSAIVPRHTADQPMPMLQSQNMRSQFRVRRLTSPFSAEEDRILEIEKPRYTRPNDGRVNGYVKFNWPKVHPAHPNAVGLPSDAVVEELVDEAEPANHSHSTSVVSSTSNSPTLISVNGAASLGMGDGIGLSYRGGLSWDINVFPRMMSPSAVPAQDASNYTVVATGEPRLLPPHFGSSAKMDRMDRRLWDFYVNNWCPGRSVLSNTNLWLRDFAQMQQNEGIRCAIQSLAGVYIYDYLPDERVRERVNNRYQTAVRHFQDMLDTSSNYEVGQGQEVITMAILMSMQDVVLVEHRLKKPYTPRWLEGSKQGEYLLQASDPGCRFWHDNNIQLDSLRVSQSIIVGRAVILAQPMMALPTAEEFNAEQESVRFGWLLHGTEKDMFEIHGGCGFSRKLLHSMSQVTFFAARLIQEPKSMMVPTTARYLYRELLDMRQWSSETENNGTAQKTAATIEWVNSRPREFVIDSDEEMTNVTAEAWRFAVLVYLLCRVMRLPRNHPDVLACLTDLANCISIMPTSGSRFTAQAPLLPVFFLGLLSTSHEHRRVSVAWFDQVVEAPVRSSVPPLYLALQRIWVWIDVKVKIPSAPTNLPKSITEREPWWEELVAQIHQNEEETLCLT